MKNIKISSHDLLNFHRGKMCGKKCVLVEDAMMENPYLLEEYFCIKREWDNSREGVATPSDQVKLKLDKQLFNKTRSSAWASFPNYFAPKKVFILAALLIMCFWSFKYINSLDREKNNSSLSGVQVDMTNSNSMNLEVL